MGRGEVSLDVALAESTSGSPVVTLAGVTLTLDAPQALVPVTVAKPWGREVWYTGMEARGESQLRGAGGTVSLLSYLNLAPARLCAREPITLLKALEPSAEPRVGELYFEIHRDKHELYVVTDVNRAAYADGRGRMRFGMCQRARACWADDGQFRAAFRMAVAALEAARANAEQQGLPTTPELETAQAEVEGFVAARELEVGDVVSVAPGVPHGLCHGVRVLEFQTPSYERRIIYASQAVATQAGWDSAEAIAAMALDPPGQPAVEAVDEASSRLAAGPDFELLEVRLEAGDRWRVPERAYAVVHNQRGPTRIRARQGEVLLNGDEAAFVPGSAREVSLEALEDSRLLLALPNAHHG